MQLPAFSVNLLSEAVLCHGQVKARLLAEAEEQEARRLTLEATEALLQKVQRKTQLFDAMARALRNETAAVEVSSLSCRADRDFSRQPWKEIMTCDSDGLA